MVESGDIVVLLPWLTAFTGRRDSRPRDAAVEGLEEAKLERASSTCRHAGGVEVAARNLLVELRSEGNEETWNTLVSKFPPEDHAAVSAAATTAAVLASATEMEDGNAPPWRPDDEYASEELFEAISSRIALPGPHGERTARCPSLRPVNSNRIADPG